MSLRIAFTLTPQGRVSAGKSGQVGNSRQIYRVLPGSTIRGALGKAWWDSPTDAYAGPDRDGAFDRLFVHTMSVGLGMPHWGPHPRRTLALVPMAYARCKYPGEGCADGAPEWLNRAARDAHRCPDCGGAITDGRGWHEEAVPSRVSTRTALDRGVAKTNQLFSRRAVDGSVGYSGTLRLSEDVGVDEPGVQWLLQDKTVFVGGQLSTMGRCRWSASVQRDRGGELPRGELLLTMRSPAILVDDVGLPSLDLGTTIDAAIARGGGLGAVERVWTRSSPASGWNSIAGLPKPTEWVLEPGSCALVRGADAAAARVLAAGLGVRRREGFGETELGPLGPARAAIRTASAPESAAVQAPSVAEQGLFDFVSRLSGSVRRALLSEARDVQRLHEQGLAPAVRPKIARILELPWARDLGPDTRGEIERALIVDVRPLITALAARTGGTS